MRDEPTYTYLNIEPTSASWQCKDEGAFLSWTRQHQVRSRNTKPLRMRNAQTAAAGIWAAYVDAVPWLEGELKISVLPMLKMG